jgi:putative tricarboxylic transport membrane protein
VVLGHYAGMAPAIFACVFVSALGDRSSTYRGAFILSLIMTVFGVALFAYVLKVPFPVFRWVLS